MPNGRPPTAPRVPSAGDSVRIKQTREIGTVSGMEEGVLVIVLDKGGEKKVPASQVALAY